MEKIPIGQFIRENRKAQGLSQEQLCADICSREALSQIENGKTFPSNQVLHRLLESLGLPDLYYAVPASEYEVEIQRLQKVARARVMAFLKAAPEDRAARREEAAGAIRELEAQTDADDLLTRQRILNEWISLGGPEGPYPPVQRREKLLEALRVTAPRFDPDRIDDFRYTQEETELINQIANTYTMEENHDAAIGLYRQLLEYLQAHSRLLSRYPVQVTMVTFNYARALVRKVRYARAAEAAEIGRKACVEYGEYQFLPQFLAILANCHAHLDHREEGERFYRLAYAMYTAFEDQNNLEHLKQDAMDTLGLSLP